MSTSILFASDCFLIRFCQNQPSTLITLFITPCPCVIQLKGYFMLALRILRRNLVVCGTSLSCAGLQLFARTLFSDSNSKRVHTRVCPPEVCCNPRLILYDVGMGTKGLCNRLLSYPIIAACLSKINNEPAQS